MAELSTADSEWMTERKMRLLVAAMNRDPDEVTRLLDEIGEARGARGVLGVCYGLAADIARQKEAERGTEITD